MRVVSVELVEINLHIGTEQNSTRHLHIVPTRRMLEYNDETGCTEDEAVVHFVQRAFPDANVEPIEETYKEIIRKEFHNARKVQQGNLRVAGGTGSSSPVAGRGLAGQPPKPPGVAHGTGSVPARSRRRVVAAKQANHWRLGGRRKQGS